MVGNFHDRIFPKNTFLNGLNTKKIIFILNQIGSLTVLMPIIGYSLIIHCNMIRSDLMLVLSRLR